MGPRAVLGGPGQPNFTREEVHQARETIRTELAPRKSRSWSLMAAMLDENLEVCRYRRDGRTGYFCQAELAEQREPEKWHKGQPVTTPGAPLEVNGPQAVEYRLATFTAEDFSSFKRHYGLEADPTLLEPGWADFLIEALASPSLAGLLLVIGFVAMYVELHAPGIGVGGLVAALCFLLFFWSRFLGGTAGWLEVTLFAAGIACVLLEIFVLPGFVIFGLGGGLLIIASLVLASQTFALPHNEYQLAQFQQSLLILAGAVGGTICVAMILNRWLPKTPVLGRIMHQPFTEEEIARVSHNESLAHFDTLLGARGTAATQLVPGGKALFGDRLVDVMADGQFIERGEPVVVVEVEGYRVIVRPASEVSPG
jgi:hypothetical protein